MFQLLDIWLEHKYEISKIDLFSANKGLIIKITDSLKQVGPIGFINLFALLITSIFIGEIASRGFDFTDESFYLLWANSPDNYFAGSSAFGIYLQPLFQVLNGDIALLRIANFFILFSASSLMFFQASLYLLPTKTAGSVQRILLILPLAVSSFVFFVVWIPSPSYNSLNLFELMILVSMVLVVVRNPQRKNYVSLGIIGATITFITFVKPTSGIAALLITAVFFTLLGLFKLRNIVVVIGGALTCIMFTLGLFAINGHNLLNFYLEGAKLLQTLDPNYELSKIFRLDFPIFTIVDFAFILCFVVFFFLLQFFVIQKQSRLIQVFFGSSLTLFVFVLALFALANLNSSSVKQLFLDVLISSLLYSLISHFFGLQKLQKKSFFLFLFTVSMPFIFAFGTNGNYANMQNSASVFWVLGTLVLITATQKSFQEIKIIWSTFGLVVMTIVATTLFNSVSSPYRQPNLFVQTSEITFGPNDSHLAVSRDFKRYFLEVQSKSKTTGFKQGTSVIDLSGEFPGTLLLMEAKGMSQPWHIGGYQGSTDFVKKSLSQSKCDDLVSAWLLLSPSDPRSVPHEVLNSVGLDLERDFVKVAEWSSPIQYATTGEQYKQELYKPLKTMKPHITNCVKG